MSTVFARPIRFASCLRIPSCCEHGSLLRQVDRRRCLSLELEGGLLLRMEGGTTDGALLLELLDELAVLPADLSRETAPRQNLRPGRRRVMRKHHGMTFFLHLSY